MVREQDLAIQCVCVHVHLLLWLCTPQLDFTPSFHPSEDRAGVGGPGLCPGFAGASCVIFMLVFASLAPVHSSVKQGLQ